MDYVKTNASLEIVQEAYTDPDRACVNANVLYVTRIQKERFDATTDYDAVKVSETAV